MPKLTDPSYINQLRQRFGIAPDKALGQHFLINPGICPKLCDAAGIEGTSQVLEIGPGLGTLTLETAARAEKVVALEVDKRLLAVLAETLQGLGNAQVVQGDALRCHWAGFIGQYFTKPVQVVGNLPYNITSPLVMALLEAEAPVQSITVMVQKEAAQRMAAPPGSRLAGAISYAVHYWAQPRLVFDVKPGSFYPPPKVTSTVLQLAMRPAPPLAGQPARRQRLFRLVKAAFGQRRKTLVNAVAAGADVTKDDVAKGLAALALPRSVRAEQLTLEQFIGLEAQLWPAAE